MVFEHYEMTTEQITDLYSSIEEDHFNDYKAKDISGKGFQKIISAFANASGGDFYVGIREDNETKEKYWEGFDSIEDANGFLQQLNNMPHVNNYYRVEFLKHQTLQTYVMKVTVFKTPEIIHTDSGKTFVRHGAQSLPVDTPDKLRRLELDKGISSYENEIVQDSDESDLLESEVYHQYSASLLPQANARKWLEKQRLIKNGKVTVAGELLFSDEPQISLPKRSSIKIYRYKTSGNADRDMLDGDPLTIEGCAYQQIYEAVKKVKEIIESMHLLHGEFEMIEYPEETLHEIITNAVLHRDYSITTDIQIRIYDNRVEIESPGKLAGHVTVKNILDAQVSRNPKLVRLINKFPNPPNKDVGEGLNTAFEAMEKLRLKAPTIEEKDNSVLVIIRHEPLASPEEIVVSYMKTHDEIRNRIAREITGIKSENKMKNVFYKLRDAGIIRLVSGHNYWVKTDEFDAKTNSMTF